jgi:hypothetical protein
MTILISKLKNGFNLTTHRCSVIKNRFDYSHLLSNYNMYMEKFGVLRG